MYRDLAPAGPSCQKHASAPAAASCVRCGEAICDICLVYDLARPNCLPCSRRAQRNRRWRAGLGLTLFVAGLLAGIGYVVTRPKRFDYGTYTARVLPLQQKVESERCDKKVTLELEEVLLAAGDLRGAVADSDAFYAHCGDWYRLRWVRYGAYERLSEHGKAVAEASKLIDYNPDDHDYRWWRGAAYEAMDQLDSAVADYRKAIEITPALDAIPFNLARALERQHKYCDATRPIVQYLKYHPQQADKPQIQAQLLRLNAAGHCVDLP